MPINDLTYTQDIWKFDTTFNRSIDSNSRLDVEKKMAMVLNISISFYFETE